MSIDSASTSYFLLIKLSEVVSLWIDGMVRWIFYLTVLEVEHLFLVVYLRVTFFNDLLSKVDIKFVTSKSIEFSGGVFDYWNLVFLTEE